MTYRPTMAEAQAIGLCWLARAKGLPDVFVLRASVVQLHPATCGWCEYPLDELMRLLKDVNTTRTPFELDSWWGLPGKARRAAIELAQGGAA